MVQKDEKNEVRKGKVKRVTVVRLEEFDGVDGGLARGARVSRVFACVYAAGDPGAQAQRRNTQENHRQPHALPRFLLNYRDNRFLKSPHFLSKSKKTRLKLGD